MALGLEDKKYVKVNNVDGKAYNIINVRAVKGGKTYNVWGSGSSVTYVVDNGVAYSEDVLNGDSVLSPKTFTPTKSGYTFVGWRTDKNASADVLTSKTMGTEPITLYAVFKRTLTLSYNGNDFTSGSVSSQTGTQYYNNGNTANPTFTLASNGFSKTDYAFSKWAMGSADGTQYSAGASVSIAENTTFYAVWKAVAKTVTPTNTKVLEHDLGVDKGTLVYGPINASIYASVTIDIESTWGEANFAGSNIYIGFGSWTKSTPPSDTEGYEGYTARTYIAEAGRAWITDEDPEGQQTFEQLGTSFTHKFAETSGNVYLFMGCVYNSGTSGYQDIKIKSPITLNPR